MKAVTCCQNLLGVDNTAYLLIFIGSAFWVFGLMFAVENKKLDFVATTQWRGIATITTNAILCWSFGESWEFSHVDRTKLHTRNILSSIQGLSLALGLKYLSEPVVHTISNSGPIIVYVMDYFRNGRAVGRRELWGIVVSSLGILVTVNSSAILEWLGVAEGHSESRFDYATSSTLVKTIVALIIFLATIGWAHGIMLTKEFKHTSNLQINLHLGLMCSLLSGVLSFVPLPGTEVSSVVATPLTLMETLQAFVFVGMFLCLSSVFYIGGLKTTKKSGNATLVGFMAVVLGYVISIFRYGEIPNIAAVIGSVSIFIGLVLVLIK